MPTFTSHEEAMAASGLTNQGAPANTGVSGSWKQNAWNAVKKAGAGIAGAALQTAGRVAGGYLSSMGGPLSGKLVGWGANVAQRAVNKMQDGVVKTGLNHFLKGMGSHGGPAPPSGHREDRPMQGTAGRHMTTQKNKITNYFGTAPSNGTRNSHAVLNNSISGGYGEKESASKNPRHVGPMMSNQYVSESPKTLYGQVNGGTGKKHRKKRHRHR